MSLQDYKISNARKHVLCAHIRVKVSPALTNTLEDSLLLEGLTNVLIRSKIMMLIIYTENKTNKPLTHCQGYTLNFKKALCVTTNSTPLKA